MLVLVGTGAIILEEEFLGSVTHMGISLAFGGIVTLMILLLGHVSGAHINPAVSIGFFMTGDLKSKVLSWYLIAQFAGAIAASALLSILFPTNEFLGATMPNAGIWPTFVIEFLMTLFLMLVILLFSKNERLKHLTARFVGLTVGLEAYFGGPFTGASMNPARSFGPAIMSGQLDSVWIYLVATTLGALATSVIWKRSKKLDSRSAENGVA